MLWLLEALEKVKIAREGRGNTLTLAVLVNFLLPLKSHCVYTKKRKGECNYFMTGYKSYIFLSSYIFHFIFSV